MQATADATPASASHTTQEHTPAAAADSMAVKVPQNGLDHGSVKPADPSVIQKNDNDKPTDQPATPPKPENSEPADAM